MGVVTRGEALSNGIGTSPASEGEAGCCGASALMEVMT